MQFCKLNINKLNTINLLILLVLIFVLSSCYHENKSNVPIPEKLLSKKEMAEILTEIQITEAGFSVNVNRKFAKKLKPEYYSKILSDHSVTMHQFKENLNYFYQSPKIMENIYETVLANLSKIKSSIAVEKKEFEKQKIVDSITRLHDSTKLIVADSLSKTTMK